MAKGIKTYTLAEMKNKYIGKVGTKKRDRYEYEIRMDVLAKTSDAARLDHKNPK